MNTLLGYESAFQERVVLYASLFPADGNLNAALRNLGFYLSALANQMFGLTIDPAKVAEILGGVLLSGVTSDVGPELGATISYVRDQLIVHQVVY